MKTIRPFLHLLLAALLFTLLGASMARAQAPAIIENGYRNVFGGPQPTTPGGEDAPTTGDPLLPSYQAQRQNGTPLGGFPINGYGTLETNTNTPTTYSATDVAYPKSSETTQVLTTMILRSAIIGRPLAVFNISYSFGGEIPPPTRIDLASGQVTPDFYRAEPLNARLKTRITSATNLTPIGAPVNATSADTDGIVEQNGLFYLVAQNPQFYWSKHAKKVYATQAGTISVQWRESNNATNSKTETYLVASSPAKPERTIFWTENGFNGPLVEVPAGRVNSVNIIYNSLVPGDVVTPYEPWLAGATDLSETEPAKKRYKTFYYETNLIHAYNVEGRVFVEYLGNPRGDGTNEPKGTEIVNIIKEATPGTRIVDLGEPVEPDPTADTTVALSPKIIAGLGLSGQPYLHQHVSSGGTKTTLYGIRETQPGVATTSGQLQQVSNEVLIYWMETSHEGQLDLKWPKQYLGYVLEWPIDPAKYSIYARPDAATPEGLDAAIATAVQLDSANNPALVHQDDPANSQAVLAPGNQFYTKVTTTDPTNRALLRFTKDDDIWFERVYSQVDPYFLNPDPYLERTVTGTPDLVGEVATGFTNITGVTVVDPDTGDELVEGVDYTVDAATGVITLIEKRYTESVATLGTLNAGDTVAVRLYAGYGYDYGWRGPEISWEARHLSLTSATSTTPLASVDFRNLSGSFAVRNTGNVNLIPWKYPAELGVWRTYGPPRFQTDVGSSSLTSPSFAVTQNGVVTLKLKHRYSFAWYTQGSFPFDGGLIQYSVNDGDWQIVPDNAFTANGYHATPVYNASTSEPLTKGRKTFAHKSAGYDLPPLAITTVEITFSSPTLPFSTVPVVVDTEIGKRIAPDLGHVAADTYGATAPVYVGYIHQPSGTAFNVDAYVDPFLEGFDEATQGAIIPVNALPENDQLEVWWYKKSTPTGSNITGTYWPSFVQKYQLQWPTDPAIINLASNQGSDDLPSLQAVGSIYTKNNPDLPGYNPNEEHAVMLNGRAWALRDDLNIPASSDPYVLLHYTEADQRPNMRVFKVERGDFTYPAIAGKILQSPMPLPLLPPPLLPDRSLASYEMPGANPEAAVSPNLGGSDAVFAHYQKFIWNDRKGIPWVYRGPHAGNGVGATPTLKMRYFYKTLQDFNFPELSLNEQPPIGTITPYLRAGTPGNYVGDAVYGVTGSGNNSVRGTQALDITFTPQWPESAPELRVGETLTLPKLGLPSVRGQASAELIYQQSVAKDTGTTGMANRQKSARLFDPTRAKVYALGNTASTNTILKNALPQIPDSVNTSLYLGKTYFPNLPPHLSGRLYYDPAVGTYGSLVFKGLFMNELVGEKYLQLNVMSAADLAAAKDLTPAGTDTDSTKIKTQWDAAIDGLATTMETFIENPAKLGTFIVDQDLSATEFDIIEGVKQFKPTGILPPHGPNAIAPDEPAEVFYSDTAVDSYAVSASGGGKGYVVLAVGNGKVTDFTPAGQPVSLQVFKVNAPLYRGELKVINSQNPLDEKLTMQHTGDFAGHPEEYDFEWRYAPPADGLPPKLYSFVRKLIAGDSSDWRLINNPPSNALDPTQDYTRFRSPSANVSTYPVVSLPGESIIINDGNGTAANGSTLPNALLRRTFSATTRPLRQFLSINLGTNDGAVVYLNNAPVAAFNAPGHDDTPTSSVPTTAPAFLPLTKIFEIDPNALVANETTNNNVITVELYSSADVGSSTTFNLRLEGLQEVENLAGWLSLTAAGDDVSPESPTGIVAVQGKNRHTIEGSSILTLSDNWIIMRYRARQKDANGNTITPANAAYVSGGGWSKWTEPQLAEGWIKRVLAGINPFQQRVKDLFNHETNTSVSLVEQAGKRWEGDIALNLENINDSGLIEIYETVLRRGKDLSITGTPAINYGGANDALLLAAGYLSDLYMILGNEAYADAANSTIAFNTDGQAAQYGDVATALFSFKGQLATVLDEELSLMRGRDDSLLPNTTKAPIYNRLIWNYTRGIDSGEAIYALNYNIKDRTWDYSINSNNLSNLPADGIISAADAAISYPQGHGDAYGHYLTALTGYYGLLNNPNFTWTPRIEAVLVLGTPVSVDYQDERKFAAAATAVARSASRTLDLTYRKEFSAAENSGWSQLQDETTNANTGRTRNWGTDDWASRGGQGALFNWVTANSLLPAVDPNPNHAGIQKIDRTTVPELFEIVAQAQAIQQTLDNADAHLNPLGLATGALAFDISPSEVDAGKTHYEQVFERATIALQNAVSAFNNAKGSTQFLRQQEDTLDDQRYAIESQEQAYTNQLIELYGTPYTDDIGPGRTYKQDYTGPDLLHSMLVDLPEIFSNDLSQKTYTLLLDPKFASDNSSVLNKGDSVDYTLSANGSLVKPNTWAGRRVSPGRMQTKVSDLIVARQNLTDALETYSGLDGTLQKQVTLYQSALTAYDGVVDGRIETNAAIGTLIGLKSAATLAKLLGENAAAATEKVAFANTEGLPKVVGLANDPSFALRAVALNSNALAFLASSGAQVGIEVFLATADDTIERLNFQYQSNISEAQFREANKQLLYDLHATLEDLKGGATAVDTAVRHLDQAKRDLYALQAEGDRIQQQRLVFRQHAAAIIQGYRTRDFAFRAFRNEALERYNALFDLAARYTYLAASAYDYETGLLDADGNASASGFYEKIVESRALGVVSDGVPQFAGASTGDPGLSGVLAELAGDWSVAKTRLGFNNPDRYATTFSLRGEKFRLVPGVDGDLPWRDKLSSYKMADITEDPDVKRYCMQVADPNGNAVPGIVIPFSSTIATGYNFFGQPLAGGDHTFTPSSFSTKIRSSGLAFRGYVGMDSPTTTSGTLGDIGATSPSTYNTGFSDADALSATPYVYLIPAGVDSMRSPPLGDSSFVRSWAVQDQAIPLPFNIANSDYSTQPAWVSAASLSEPAFTLRKHQAFRAVPDGTNFQGGYGFTNARLIGRSAWNSQWKIVIPGNTLLNNPNLGINTFINTVKDIKLHLETYSYSGN